MSCAVAEIHRIGIDVDSLNLRNQEFNLPIQLLIARAHYLLGIGHAEWHKQQARLVDVIVVAINDRDLGAIAQQVSQPIGCQCSTGAGAQDDNSVGYDTYIMLAPAPFATQTAREPVAGNPTRWLANAYPGTQANRIDERHDSRTGQ